MKRKFWVGASFSALVMAAMAPWSASQANGVSIRVNTPEFGIRIGAPHFPPPVYYPVPVHQPRYYEYAPPPVVYAPPPPVYGYPYHYAGGGGYGRPHHYWRPPHWRHPHWRHPHERNHRGDHDDHRGDRDDDRQRHWR